MSEARQILEAVKEVTTFPFKERGLSQKENTVVCLYTFGLTIEEIWERFKAPQTISTIEGHLDAACRKLNIHRDDLTKEWRKLLLEALYPMPLKEKG